MGSNFDDLNINENILRGIYSYGFEKPSTIQQKSIPEIIKGSDVISQAQSGTGKTGAYVIGLLNKIDLSVKKTECLILLPTHELVNQVYDVMTEISKYMDINILKLIGGTNISECIRDLSLKPEILIGTPGRVLDMIQRGHIISDDLKILVLDEADEILSYGFKDTIYNIIISISKKCQICLFSATLPDDILDLTHKFMNNPQKILIKNEELTLEGIQQFYVKVKDNNWKYDIITDLYDVINVNQCIIYINSKIKINEIYQRFLEDDFPVSYISGERSSDDRKKIMEEFRSGKIRILLSTDLLSRGIDIQQLSLVINFDLPREKETYIHRIGRSGRYGRKGIAINLINDKEIQDLKNIEEFYNSKINELPENIKELLS
uniref:Helicase n=1 Tax=viral metagenome TaxID=1070528 RepID=A0A6C0BSJ4_9ZZZZ